MDDGKGKVSFTGPIYFGMRQERSRKNWQLGENLVLVVSLSS
jgi:hypothetical protein